MEFQWKILLHNNQKNKLSIINKNVWNLLSLF
jgi:hypothetical protein